MLCVRDGEQTGAQRVSKALGEGRSGSFKREALEVRVILKGKERVGRGCWGVRGDVEVMKLWDVRERREAICADVTPTQDNGLQHGHTCEMFAGSVGDGHIVKMHPRDARSCEMFQKGACDVGRIQQDNTLQTRAVFRDHKISILEAWAVHTTQVRVLNANPKGGQPVRKLSRGHTRGTSSCAGGVGKLAKMAWKTSS